MPQRGSWLELEIDKKGAVYVRIDRKRKLPVTTCCCAPWATAARHDEAILKLFDNSHLHQEHAREGLDDARGGGADRALQEAAPRRAADARQRRRNLLRGAVLRPQALRPDAVGRYKLNSRLHGHVSNVARPTTCAS
jgi:DNA-directed RNA polymerase subunit beta